MRLPVVEHYTSELYGEPGITVTLLVQTRMTDGGVHPLLNIELSLQA
jgi:hypothetical protein